MTSTRKYPDTVRMTPLAKARLAELVTMLATTKPVTLVGEPDLVGALIYAAIRSPLEAIKAEVSAYQDYELDHRTDSDLEGDPWDKLSS